MKRDLLEMYTDFVDLVFYKIGKLWKKLTKK